MFFQQDGKSAHLAGLSGFGRKKKFFRAGEDQPICVSGAAEIGRLGMGEGASPHSR